MTAPAEDPRGGEAWRVTTYVAPVAHRCPWGQECPPVRPTSAEEVRHDHDPEVEGCNPATCPAYRALPAGGRAQPTQELREAVIGAIHHADIWIPEAERAADRVLALPAVAALLDAQAAVNRVEAVMAAWNRGEPVGGYLPREIRRALDGP